MKSKEVTGQDIAHSEGDSSLEIQMSDEMEQFDNRQMDLRTILAIVVRLPRCPFFIFYF